MRIYGFRVKTGDKADALDCKAMQPERRPIRRPNAEARAEGLGHRDHDGRAPVRIRDNNVHGERRREDGDGKTISFALGLSMHRESLEETHGVLRAGNAAVDPLVVNSISLAPRRRSRTSPFVSTCRETAARTRSLR